MRDAPPYEGPLALPGGLNRRNAGAALAALEAAGVPRSEAAPLLGQFTGTGRRFEVHDGRRRHGGRRLRPPSDGDRAHDRGRARALPGRTLRVLFQPHLYSRTRHLADELAEALAAADDVAVTDVYAAREQQVPGVTGKLVIDGLSDRGVLAAWAPTVDEGAARLAPARATRGRRARARRRRRRPGRRPAAAVSAVGVDEHVPLSRFTTIGTGGAARWLARPETVDELQEVLGWAADRELAVEPIGLGSNVLPHDDGVEAVVVKLGGELAAARVDGELIVAGGGASNAVCLHRARDAGLGGFEFASAIPGTAGGGVRMNAGAYGRELRDVLVDAVVVDARGAQTVTAEELELRYRHSKLAPGQVVAEVRLRLERGHADAMRAHIAELLAERKATQPTNKRTFGSVFKNPAGITGRRPNDRGVRPQGPSGSAAR